jgi:hypothetical protein
MPPPRVQALIARLPRTFGPALSEKLKGWELLFPAEQRLLRAQLDWLASLPPSELTALVLPINAIERKMNLRGLKQEAAGLSIAETAEIARSPYYPQWRSEVEKVFERIDQGVESSGGLPGFPRLVVNVLPGGLPFSGKVLWGDLAGQGHWIELERPFGEIQPSFVNSLAGRTLPKQLEAIEGLWILECEARLSSELRAEAVTGICWPALEAVRKHFLERLNSMQKTLQSADEIHAELRRLDIREMLGPRLGGRPQVREFIRTLLLSGNGSLVFNNSFVQWGASESMRRAQPQALVASFGIRVKPKPFSSLVWFEDQQRSNPNPDDPDPEGSLTDGLMLSEYVLLSAQRLAAYHNRTLFVMAVEGLNKVLVIAPPGSASLPIRMTGAELAGHALQWLGAAA